MLADFAIVAADFAIVAADFAIVAADFAIVALATTAELATTPERQSRVISHK